MLLATHSAVPVVTLIHCIYASRATSPLSEADIESLLLSSRRNNLRRDITGMLLHIDGSFFQVLEGEAAVVDATYEVIARDARHDRVTQIIREPLAQRSFAEWSMGYASLGQDAARRLAGGNDFFASAECLQSIQPGRAKKLLAAFGAGRWRVEHTGAHRIHARVG